MLCGALDVVAVIGVVHGGLATLNRRLGQFGDGVDFDLGGRATDGRGPIGKAFGMRRVGRIERALSVSGDLLDAAMEDVSWREEREAGVVMLVVMPPEEGLEPSACMQLAGARRGA